MTDTQKLFALRVVVATSTETIRKVRVRLSAQAGNELKTVEDALAKALEDRAFTP